jgi:hypothetical protein
LVFAPFGLFSLFQAFILWVFLTQYMIFLSVLLLLKLYTFQMTKHFIIPIFAFVILFRPTLLTLVSGQLSGFLLLVIVCILFLWEGGKWWQGAVFLPILALKPNLGVPIIIFLSIYLIIHRKYSSIIAEGISGLAIIIIGMIQDKAWISDFLRAGNTKLFHDFGFAPNIWGMSNSICTYNLDCSIGLGSVLAIIFIVGFLYLLIRNRRNSPPAMAVGLAITTMLILTPYTWTYDQLLLIIPIIIITLSLAKDGYKFIPIVLIFLIIDITVIILLWIDTIIQKEIWNGVIPLSLFGFLFWYLSKNRKIPHVNEILTKG